MTKSPATAKSPLAGLATALELWKKYKTLPLGPALGSALGFGALFLNPEALPAGWSRAWFITGFAIAGLGLERLLHWIFGRWVDPLLTHWGAKWTAFLELKRLNEFEKRGIINPADAEKLKDRIAKRAVAGGPKSVRNRPASYRKRRLPPPPNPPSQAGPSSPVTPAA